MRTGGETLYEARHCMSLDQHETEAHPVTDVGELVAVLASWARPGAPLIGLEHEKLLYATGTNHPVPHAGPKGVEALLASFEASSWEPFREAPGLPIIAMKREAATLSLEPGGQLELSGSPFASAREVHEENLAHLKDLKARAAALGITAVTLGLRPYTAVADMPWMPKTRYRLMRETLGRRGKLALHMMLLTGTGQVSLDFVDEADLKRKITALSRLSPVLVALFANSPLHEGKPSGYLSFRSHIWSDVDPARCGIPAFLVDGSFSYRAYAEWALDAPLLFLRRAGQYVDPKLTFRQLLKDGYQGQPATIADWNDHLSTLFPEMRIKKVLEVRSADGVNAALTAGLVALLRGLAYDATALGELEAALPKLGHREHLALHAAAQVKALDAPLPGAGTLKDLAREVVAIARRGLGRIDPLDAPLLDPVDEVAQTGRTRAHVLLELQQLPPEQQLLRFEI